MPHFLIIEARFYEDLADELVKGATAALDAAGVTHDKVSVPGVLETPAALALAIDSGRYDGYVMLGCVIRGETSHYDIVAIESARAVMDLSVRHRLALGNGILTVENGEQAWVRASTKSNGKNKGGAAAEAALAMHALKSRMATGQ